MPQDDERDREEARQMHSRTISQLADLRGDVNSRISAVLQDQEGRSPENPAAERQQREWVRGELNSLQRRIDQALDNLH